MTQEVNHTAQVWLDVLRAKIDTQVRALLHPHHMAHEPGGSDAVGIPVIALDDVVISSRPDDGDALVYVQGSTEADDYWTNGAGGSGGAHEAALTIPVSAPVWPEGPVNLRNKNSYIMAVNAIAKGGAADIEVTGASFTLAGDGEQSTIDMRTYPFAWPPGRRLSILALTGDATWVTVTWLVSDTATTTD